MLPYKVYDPYYINGCYAKSQIIIFKYYIWTFSDHEVLLLFFMNTGLLFKSFSVSFKTVIC